jgi:hypothetical protein
MSLGGQLLRPGAPPGGCSGWAFALICDQGLGRGSLPCGVLESHQGSQCKSEPASRRSARRPASGRTGSSAQVGGWTVWRVRPGASETNRPPICTCAWYRFGTGCIVRSVQIVHRSGQIGHDGRSETHRHLNPLLGAERSLVQIQSPRLLRFVTRGCVPSVPKVGRGPSYQVLLCTKGAVFASTAPRAHIRKSQDSERTSSPGPSSRGCDVRDRSSPCRDQPPVSGHRPGRRGCSGWRPR